MSDYTNMMDQLSLTGEERQTWTRRLAGAAAEAGQDKNTQLGAALAAGAQPGTASAAGGEPQAGEPQAGALPGGAATPIGGTDRRPRRRNARRGALRRGAVVGLLALTCVGGAAYAGGGYANVAQFANDIFSGAAAPVEVVERVGLPVNCAANSAGVTVSADAIIGDARNLTMVFSVVKDDGTPFEDLPVENDRLMLGFGRDDVNIVGSYAMGGYSYFYDADPDDAAVQFVMCYDVDAPGGIVGKKAIVHLEDLGVYQENMGLVPLAEGSWDLKFKLGYEDATRALQAGRDFEVSGMEARLDAASISPVGLSLDYVVFAVPDEFDVTSNGGGAEIDAHTERLLREWQVEDGRLTVTEYDENGEATVTVSDLQPVHPEKDFFELGPVVLTFVDGSTVQMGEPSGGTLSDDEATGGARIAQGFSFNRIVDLDQVASVSVAGVTLAVA